MTWTKTGVVFRPDNDFDWMVSHANFPTAVVIEDCVRVYFSPRNKNGHSVIACVDMDRSDPSRLMRVHPEPVLLPGQLGTFDDCGVQPNCALRVGEEIYLYYLGWNPAANNLSRNSTGLAVSRDNGLTFTRMYEGPVLDRSMKEPYFAYTPWILREDGIWHCWYGSGTGWKLVNDKPEGLFHIKYCYSTDGVHWVRPNISCIMPVNPMDVNCRPTVVKENGIYRMWYSHRKAEDFRGGKNSYRIGYAESTDRVHWKRLDDRSGIEVSKTEGDWDSQMQLFCSVVEVDGDLHMYYAGDGFGLTGFGHAVWTR